MHISIPTLSLVVLIGPSGSGKSTFASRHFRPSEVLLSEYRQYCWSVASLDDLRLLPFHLLATEGQESEPVDPMLKRERDSLSTT